MAIVLNGTTGITNDGGYTGDGVSFADTTPANTLVTTTGGRVGIGNNSPSVELDVNGSVDLRAATTETRSIQIGEGRNGSGFSFVDFVGDSTYTDYALRIIRQNTGANAPSQLIHRGTGNLEVTAQDAAPIVFATSNTEQMRITSAGLLQFNSGYGSVATAFGCRAWVNFNGTGTVAIRASGNVSSITDNGTGDYTVNFTTAMPDANYIGVMSGSPQNGRFYSNWNGTINNATTEITNTTTAYRLACNIGTLTDATNVYVAIFR
jgi:hypothetical protein